MERRLDEAVEVVFDMLANSLSPDMIGGSLCSLFGGNSGPVPFPASMRRFNYDQSELLDPNLTRFHPAQQGVGKGLHEVTQSRGKNVRLNALGGVEEVLGSEVNERAKSRTKATRRRAETSRGSARRRAQPSRRFYIRPASLTITPVLYSPGELNHHAGQLAPRARPDPGLSDLLRLPYLPYSCDIRPSGPYTSRFVLTKVILEVL
ncbi:hypothetical protein F2Q70_00003862 [Brassica cretica]|uniref:Uncharacterized protein n=1 Tax=Brassica cretica TaxID=69181 RepID=A0A8S9IU96_BRACR|nr:hypothetical protein F2Q70_00003862 [Brassica cretica]